MIILCCGNLWCKTANGSMVARMKEFAKCAIWAILKNDSFGYQCYSINWMSTEGRGTPIVILPSYSFDYEMGEWFPFIV